MDNTGLDTARTNAQNAQQGVSDMTTSAPGLLNTLKQNLVGIFSDNNPIVGARNNALSDYLSEGANSRAAMLPSNVGDVPGYAGRPLTLSPTEQDAVTTSRQAAAYAPLNTYNAILQSMFGQVPDIVKNAGDIYGAQIQGAQGNANMLEQLYKDSISQYGAEHSASGSNGLLDAQTILKLVAAMRGGNTSNVQANNSNRPPLDTFVTQPKSLQDTIAGLTIPQSLYQSDNTANASASFTPAKPSSPKPSTPPLHSTGKPSAAMKSLHITF